VLELVAAGHVAEGVDTGYGCTVVEHALVLIDAELTAVLHVEVVLRVEGVGVGAATGCYEHSVCRDFEQFFTVLGGALRYDGYAAVGVLTDFGEARVRVELAVRPAVADTLLTNPNVRSVVRVVCLYIRPRGDCREVHLGGASLKVQCRS